jgi:hypothetical protein
MYFLTAENMKRVESMAGGGISSNIFEISGKGKYHSVIFDSFKSSEFDIDGDGVRENIKLKNGINTGSHGFLVSRLAEGGWNYRDSSKTNHREAFKLSGTLNFDNDIRRIKNAIANGDIELPKNVLFNFSVGSEDLIDPKYLEGITDKNFVQNRQKILDKLLADYPNPESSIEASHLSANINRQLIETGDELAKKNRQFKAFFGSGNGGNFNPDRLPQKKGDTGATWALNKYSESVGANIGKTQIPASLTSKSGFETVRVPGVIEVKEIKDAKGKIIGYDLDGDLDTVEVLPYEVSGFNKKSPKDYDQFRGKLPADLLGQLPSKETIDKILSNQSTSDKQGEEIAKLFDPKKIYKTEDYALLRGYDPRSVKEMVEKDGPYINVGKLLNTYYRLDKNKKLIPDTINDGDETIQLSGGYTAQTVSTISGTSFSAPNQLREENKRLNP